MAWQVHACAYRHMYVCLFFLAGQWDFKAPGLTAIGHPAPLSLAETHGVFVLEDMKSPWEKYQQGKTAIWNKALKWMGYFVADSLQPSMVASAKCFLHKQTVKKLKERGAVIPEVDLVLTCTLLYVSNVVLHARKLVFQPPCDPWHKLEYYSLGRKVQQCMVCHPVKRWIINISIIARVNIKNYIHMH